MAEYKNREHYIPFRRSDLVKLLLADKTLPEAEKEPFSQFARLIMSVFHFEYASVLDDLKDEYAPFDPDSETKPLTPLTPEERQKELSDLFAKFIGLMERANFKHLSQDDVKAAMEAGSSDWGINMNIDFNVFERLEMFARGDTVGKRTRRRMLNLWRLEEVKLPIYRRLVFIIKLRPHKRLGSNVETRAVYLKIFKDIPKLDLEMLLPGARVQMPGFQQLQMGGSLLGGLGMVLWKVSHEILMVLKKAAGLAMAGLMEGGMLLWGPMVALFGWGYKQYSSYQSTKQTYSMQLTESLYYQNLDNNAGVLTRLLDEAEEQECREVLLAYFCLWRFAPPQGWTSEQLDEYVEMYLEAATKLKVDFEVGDALAKLERLRLVEKNDANYRAVPLAGALEALDETWDNYFKYSNKDVPMKVS